MSRQKARQTKSVEGAGSPAAQPPEGGLRDRLAQLEALNRRLEREIASLRLGVGPAGDSAAPRREGAPRQRRLAEIPDTQPGEVRGRLQAEKVLGQTQQALRLSEEELRRQAELLDLAHNPILVHGLNGHIQFWNRGAQRTYGWRRDEAIGRISHALLQTRHSGSLPEMMAQLLREGHWEGELIQTTRDHRRVTVVSHWVLRRDEQGRPEAVLQIDNDITARKEAEHQARAQQRRLFTVLNMLPGYVTLKDRRYRYRFASHGFLERFSEPQDRPCYEVQFNRSGPCPDCPLERILLSGRPESWEETLPDGHAYQVWGMPFRDTDGEPLLLELAMDIMERKRLERRVAEAGDVERRRIGRDLHDTLGQSLTGLGYLVGGLAQRLANLGEEEKRLGEQIVAAVNDAVEQVRALAHGLDPVGLDGRGLAEALEELARRTEQTSELPCRATVSGPVALDETTAAQAYRIAQEAVTNAVRHARAGRLRLSLQGDDGRVVLRVADDGVGLGPDARQGQGMGLRIMRHRANAVGGRLRIQRPPGGGTAVVCTLPAPAGGAARESKP